MRGRRTSWSFYRGRFTEKAVGEGAEDILEQIGSALLVKDAF
jgi:hypothetical protein